MHLLTELFKSNENYSVSITVGKAVMVVEIRDKCRCLASSTSDDSNNDAVIAASVLSVYTGGNSYSWCDSGAHRKACS